jgi:hypothetical protein
VRAVKLFFNRHDKLDLQESSCVEKVVDMGTETELSKDIRNTLTKMGVWCIRIASGTINVGKRWIRMSEPGTPDISLPGLGAWLEVKTKTGKISDVQKAWHLKAAENRVKVATVRSVEESVEKVKGWIDERNNATSQG